MEYDDDLELTRYVCDHFQQLMTPFEWKVFRAMHGRMKADFSKSPEMAEGLRQRWGLVGDPEIDAELADGHEAFKCRLRDRMLRDHASDIFVNRCPRCGRIVRTPQALQCFWCGFDWH